MTLYKLETIKSPSDSLNRYALIAEMPIKSLFGHFGHLNGGFYLKMRQWQKAGDRIHGVENSFNYSVRIGASTAVEIYCTDRLATEDVTNNLVAVYDEENLKIKFYVKSLVLNTIMYLTLIDESPSQRLKIYKHPFFYADVTPDFICEKWKPHPIGYFSKSTTVALGQTYEMNTGILAPKKYDNTLVEVDVLMRSGTGKIYRTKQFITLQNETSEENPTVRGVTTIYADTTNTTGTTIDWLIVDGKLVLSINAVTEATDIKVLAMEKFI